MGWWLLGEFESLVLHLSEFKRYKTRLNKRINRLFSNIPRRLFMSSLNTLRFRFLHFNLAHTRALYASDLIFLLLIITPALEWTINLLIFHNFHHFFNLFTLFIWAQRSYSAWNGHGLHKVDTTNVKLFRDVWFGVKW